MGAVSYIDLSAEAKKDFPFLDTFNFGGGYIDDWGSEFIIDKTSDGRYVMSLRQLGGYLHESARGGWQNDYTLKAITDGTFSGSIFQWGCGETHRYKDIEYLVVNNELIGISQGGVLYWTKDNDESVSDLVKRCVSIDSDFFCYGERPIRRATEQDFKDFPATTDPNDTLNKDVAVSLNFVEIIPNIHSDFFKSWTNLFSKR